MATQAVAGTITPEGDVTEFLIEADNPGGTITPFGSVVAQVDFAVDELILSGSITPEGEVTTESDSECFPTPIFCEADPVTDYTCGVICEENPTPPQPSLNLAGVIIPIGTVIEDVLGCTAVNIPAVVESIVDQIAQRTWFKQMGFIPVKFSGNKLYTESSFPLVVSEHTVGVPPSHTGQIGPVLSDDYEVSVYVRVDSDAGSGGVTADHTGGGVIGRIPNDAAFFDISGVYWVYNSGNFKLQVRSTPGDFYQPIDVEQLVSSAGYEDQIVRMTLRFRGNVITGLVNGLQLAQITDNTFTAGGRVGVMAPWFGVVLGYVKGPFLVRALDGAALIYDALEAADGTALEGHLTMATSALTSGWTDVGTTEELDIVAAAGSIASTITRQRAFSGLTPGDQLRIRGTISLNRGAEGSGLEFGLKVIGESYDKFIDALGDIIADPIAIDVTLTVPLSGEVVMEYGAFGDDSLIPAGAEWDAGNYHWIFDLDDLIVVTNCEGV